jgi:hypothetical protein
MRQRHATLFLLLGFLATVLPSLRAQELQRPYRGTIPWVFLLCQFSDSPAPPNPASYYQQMTVTPGTKGLADYVQAVSYGAADLDGATVHGWYVENHTIAYEKNLTATSSSGRKQRYNDCLAAAAASKTDPFVPTSSQRAYVITSPGLDLVGFEDCCAVGGDTVALPEIAHEFGHGINLEHSFSNNTTYHNACWSQPGEYDNQWDLMSAGNIYADPTHAFGGGPPFLDGYHLDEMGWLPQPKIFTLGLNGILSGTVTVAALTHPEASGYQLVRVPFDSSDPYHYYTIEYRTVDSWDSGIPNNIVLINEVKLNTNDSLYQTFLLRDPGASVTCETCKTAITGGCTRGNGAPTQSVNTNGVTITIQSTASTSAVVNISTQFALPCAQGFVWRSATSVDRTCVTPATRTQATADNAAGPSHKQANSDNCVQGYVWRQVTPSDHVCVTPAARTQYSNDTANSYNNVNQTLATYGPTTCKTGFKWRNIDDQDYACVSYASYTQAQADDAAAGTRRQLGSDTCLSGFVWRTAFPKDHVCVTPAVRTQTQTDNQQASTHIAKPNA